MNPGNYQYSGYMMPMLSVGAAIAALGFFVFVREHWSRNGVLFLLMCLSISLYLCAAGASYACLDDGLSLLWIRISQLGSIFIPSTIFLFTSARMGLAYRYRFLLAASLVLSTLFTLGNFFTDLHIKGSGSFFWGKFVQYGPLGFVFTGFFFCIMVFILRLFWREYRRSTTERHKKRIGGLLIAFSGGYLGAVDFLPALGIPVYPFGYIPIFFFVITSAYVIMRYKLVDITPEVAAAQILETMEGAVIVVDLESRIQVINRVALEMLGYRKSELLGQDLVSILPVLADMSAAGTGAHSSGRETVWHGRDGRKYDVSVFASPLTEGGSVPLGMVFVALDITERKQAEEQLKESLSIKRATLESTADGILVVDDQGNVVDYNGKFTDLWNLPPELMEQKNDDRLLQHVLGQLKSPETFIRKVRELYDHPDAENFDEVLFKDGRIFERYSIPHRLEGRSVGRVWSFRDVTERKRVEQALQLTQFAIDRASIGCFWIAEDGRLFYVNDQACRSLGYTCEELLGRSVPDIDPELTPGMWNAVWQDLLRAKVLAFETIHQRKDGTRFPVEITANYVAFGEQEYSCAFVRDITERKQADARLKSYSDELVEINEELKKFAYIVSHDLRAPLVNIKGFSQELDRSLREIEPCFDKHLPLLDLAEKERIAPILKKDIPEALKFIGSSVNRMDNLINAILKLSRAGRRKLDPEPLQMRNVVLDILNTLEHQLASHGVAVTVGDLPVIVADRTAMEQIFGNLLDNAIKYLEPGRPGVIAVSSERNEQEFSFHVRDNGRGMAREDIPKAFEIFRRVGRQDVPGEGLGLAYAKTLIRSLGGRIWCESELGAGTVFSFTVPLTAQDREPALLS